MRKIRLGVLQLIAENQQTGRSSGSCSPTSPTLIRQGHYEVDIVGPVMPDTSWASKEAERFDHRQFQIDWQTHQAICPAGHTSRDWGHIPDRHGQPSIRVRFPLRLCRSCPLHTQCTLLQQKF